NIPAVDFSQTIFSQMNLVLSFTLLLILPISLFYLGRKVKVSEIPDLKITRKELSGKKILISGAERLDYSQIISKGLGISFILIAVYKAFLSGDLSVIDPNYLNFILLGLGLLLTRNIADFLSSVKNSMGAAAGILIQFPLYFGIMGIMKYSGLVETFSGFLISISNETTFPLFTFLSAGLVNIFVPSGGGQWAVQGPIIVEASQNLGVPLSKSIMALAYGDQITNMLQPFWALPLLGITGLKARDIIPYPLFLMLIRIVVFIAGLLIF
ncbi:MAG: TIGR00366 family protein, partial [Bacteroidales bacterium]|nr:TIGR00366 family protein [Bacteroidales bacterium]